MGGAGHAFYFNIFFLITFYCENFRRQSIAEMGAQSTMGPPPAHGVSSAVSICALLLNVTSVSQSCLKQ